MAEEWVTEPIHHLRTSFDDENIDKAADELLAMHAALVKKALDELVSSNAVLPGSNRSVIDKQIRRIIHEFFSGDQLSGHNIFDIMDSVGDIVCILHDRSI